MFCTKPKVSIKSGSTNVTWFYRSNDFATNQDYSGSCRHGSNPWLAHWKPKRGSENVSTLVLRHNVVSSHSHSSSSWHNLSIGPSRWLIRLRWLSSTSLFLAHKLIHSWPNTRRKGIGYLRVNWENQENSDAQVLLFSQVSCRSGQLDRLETNWNTWLASLSVISCSWVGAIGEQRRQGFAGCRMINHQSLGSIFCS